MTVSVQRRQEILDALRRGTVPQRSLDALAVGLDRFEEAFDEELKTVARGGASFKAVRGEYGSGKTFFTRWLQERALAKGFATAEVQVSETETPLHRLETVYRRLIERLRTSDTQSGAWPSIVDGWFFTLEQDVLAEGSVSESDAPGLNARVTELMEKRLALITRSAPSFAAALRAYRQAVVAGETGIADGLLAWLGGQPNVGADVKRRAMIKGDVDHFGALSFLQGLLVMLRDSGRPGLVFVLDEVETLQRVRSDVREKSLNALRQLIDEVDSGRFPGLYVLITGTTAFFEGPQGVQRLPPLAQRLHVDFGGEARFDNARAPQVRLPGFDLELLQQVGCRVRDLFASGTANADRVRQRVDDACVAQLARTVTGHLGGKVGVAPRIYLKKLVVEILDKVDQHADFDPLRHGNLDVKEAELTITERAARGAADPDDIELP
ncbi:MAG: BREX system ATP-binding protein BrxD [Planctomycetota bacterium]